MIVTKLLIAVGIGFVYSFASFASLIAGTSAIVHRGIRGGLAAGAGTALGLGFYAGLAIAGLGMMEYFLRSVHLAILEIVIGVLFVGTGVFLLIRKRKQRDNTETKTTIKKHGLWPYFVANLSLVLSGPQKIAYITGLFLFFDLHLCNWHTKAFIPVAVLCGSWIAWLVYSAVVARTGSRIAATPFVRHNLERLKQARPWKAFVKIRRSFINKHMVRRLIRLVKFVLVAIGLFLIFKGILFFAS